MGGVTRERLAMVLAAVATAGGALAPSFTAARPVSAVGFVGNGFVQAPGGPFMTDSHGRKLQLRGFNLVAKCPADSKPSAQPGTPCIPRTSNADPVGDTNYFLSPSSSDPDRRFTDADAARLAGLGFNFARVGIIWRGLEPGPASPPGGNVPDNPTYCGAHPANTPFTPLAAAAEPFDQATIDAYLANIDSEVNLLAAHGIYSLIDMHQDAWGEVFNHAAGTTPWEGEGAPFWATCTAGLLPNVNTASSDGTWNAGYTHNAAMADAYDHFWNNDVSANLQGEYLRAWQAVAQHYTGNPWVVGYDPYNEPYDTYLTPTALFDARLQCFYGGAVAAATACSVGNVANPGPGFIPTVNAVDSQHLTFFEEPITTDFGQPLFIGGPVLGKLPFDRLVVNFHVYGLVGAFLGGALGTPGECATPDCAVNENLTMSQFDLGRSLTSTNQPGGPAWLLSEWGAEDNPADLGNVANLADSSPISGTPVSWTYWAALQNHDPTGDPHERLLDSSRQLIQPKDQVIVRAYPRATAGTPTSRSQKYDTTTAAFDFAYAPDHAIAAPTEIVVPPPRYGGGYKVTVSAAAVTSPCGANPVTLAADPQATAVTVHIEPAAGCVPNFVTTVCNPASPTSANNPCPPNLSANLPNTAALRVPPAQAALELGAGMGLGLVATGLVRRRRRKVRHS